MGGAFFVYFRGMKTDLIIIPDAAQYLRHEADWRGYCRRLYDNHKLVPKFQPDGYPCWAHRKGTQAAPDDITEYAEAIVQFYLIVPKVPRLPSEL